MTSFSLMDDYKQTVPTAPVAPAISGVNPYPSQSVPETNAPPSLMQRASSYMQSSSFQEGMGQLAQAVMGPHQQTWQANMGKQLVENVKKDAFSKATAKAVSNEALTKEDLKHLDAAQIMEVHKLKQDSTKQIWDREDQLVKRIQAARELGLDETRTQALIDNYTREYDLSKQKMQQTEDLTKAGWKHDEAMAKLQTGPQFARIQAEFGSDPNYQRATNAALDYMRNWAAANSGINNDPTAYSNEYARIMPYFMRGEVPPIQGAPKEEDGLSGLIDRAVNKRSE